MYRVQNKPCEQYHHYKYMYTQMIDNNNPA